MACGIPVVTSHNSSIPEVVGDAALLTNPDSPDEIAAALQRIFEDGPLRQQLSVRGLARARELTWDVTAQRTWQLLAEEAAC